MLKYPCSASIWTVMAWMRERPGLSESFASPARGSWSAATDLPEGEVIASMARVSQRRILGMTCGQIVIVLFLALLAVGVVGGAGYWVFTTQDLSGGPALPTRLAVPSATRAPTRTTGPVVLPATWTTTPSLTPRPTNTPEPTLTPSSTPTPSTPSLTPTPTRRG